MDLNFKNSGDKINLYFLKDLIKKGKEKISPWAKISPETIYAFSYTSGTTGNAKGAMISHNNLCYNLDADKLNPYFKDGDVYFSYLLMAHAMERSIFNNCLNSKVKIGIYSGDFLKIFEDMQYLKPTFFISVPRIFNKLYDKIKNNIKTFTGLKRSLTERAIKVKLDNLKNKKKFNHIIYDLLIFKKIRAILGGKVRILGTGSAPLHKDILNFFKIEFSCPFVECYGQTVQVDVPEINYFNGDLDENGVNCLRGEIFIRSDCIVKGYYKLDSINEKSFINGWFMSGDIGAILPGNNALKIIDRKKNIFKLSQGVYIAPEKLENIYNNSSPLIGDIFVYGDSLKHFLIAVINIDKNDLQKLAKEIGVKFEKDCDLTKSEDCKSKLLDLFLKVNNDYNLNSFEKLKGLIIDIVPWACNKDLLTNTMKKKRNALKNFYIKDLDKLYNELS